MMWKQKTAEVYIFENKKDTMFAPISPCTLYYPYTYQIHPQKPVFPTHRDPWTDEVVKRPRNLYSEVHYHFLLEPSAPHNDTRSDALPNFLPFLTKAPYSA